MSDGLARLWSRLRLAIGRGRTTQVDDSTAAQVHQVRMGADELRDATPRVAEYGFVSNPPPGTDVIVVFIAGERTNGVIVGTNNQTLRMRNLASGEVAIHDDKGRFVLLGAAGIHVQGKDDPITVETTSDITATAGGDVSVTAGGDISLHASGTITLAAPQVAINATTLTVTAATVVHGNTAITGDTAITGATAIVGDTSIAGALTNNGHDIGATHEHAPGTFHAGGTAITGTSGGVTP